MRLALLIVLTSAIYGCGGGGDSSPAPVEPPPVEPPPIDPPPEEVPPMTIAPSSASVSVNELESSSQLTLPLTTSRMV